MIDTKVLVDADFFLYRAATSAETEMDYSQDLTVVVGDFKRGQRIFQYEMDKLSSRFDTGEHNLILTFTDQQNFRKDIDPSYKGHRTKRKPAGYLKLKGWAMSHFNGVIKPRLEADDCLGILATRGDLTNFVLVSPDKDMRQIPCRIYDLKNEYTQTPEAAHRKVFEQTLTGDSTDGYSGCVGVGPKRAGIILDQVKDQNYWPAVVQAFLDADMTEKDALRNLQLAKILQSSNWDSINQVPILYHP